MNPLELLAIVDENTQQEILKDIKNYSAANMENAIYTFNGLANGKVGWNCTNVPLSTALPVYTIRFITSYCVDKDYLNKSLAIEKRKTAIQHLELALQAINKFYSPGNHVVRKPSIEMILGIDLDALPSHTSYFKSGLYTRYGIEENLEELWNKMTPSNFASLVIIVNSEKGINFALDKLGDYSYKTSSILSPYILWSHFPNQLSLAAIASLALWRRPGVDEYSIVSSFVEWENRGLIIPDSGYLGELPLKNFRTSFPVVSTMHDIIDNLPLVQSQLEDLLNLREKGVSKESILHILQNSSYSTTDMDSTLYYDTRYIVRDCILETLQTCISQDKTTITKEDILTQFPLSLATQDPCTMTYDYISNELARQGILTSDIINLVVDMASTIPNISYKSLIDIIKG